MNELRRNTGRSGRRVGSWGKKGTLRARESVDRSGTVSGTAHFGELGPLESAIVMSCATLL